MLTQQEARQALVNLAKETVRLWNAEGLPRHRRFMHADDLELNAIGWVEIDGEDISLAAWWYLDAFLDAAGHGFKDLDGIPWPDAVTLVEEVAERLTEGRPIEDARILRYAPPERQGCNPLGAVFRFFKPR